MRVWPLRPGKKLSSSQLLSITLAVLMLAVSGCVSVKYTKSTPALLKAYDRQSATALIEKVNKLQQLSSVKGSASIRLTDLRLAEQGKVEPYYPADGLIVLQRPENIRLLIRVPVIRRNIADMTSDGERFRIAISYPEEYRRFLIGSNNRSYEDRISKMNIGSDKKQQQVSSIAEIRPQHITEALLVKPLAADGSLQYFVADFVREESEAVAGKSPRRILRTYQVLYVLQPANGSGELRVLRQFWFDRTQASLPLAHMQIFDPDGSVVSEVDYQKYSGSNSFPHHVEIVRARNNYALELNFNDDIEENGTVEQRAFLLENNENLPVKDLDAPQSSPGASPEH